ncbi:MAG: hypothetical protein ABGY71_12485 [bacterium]|nr:hypothetical protein [Planctomycetota bacterium]HIL52622.1 hypothetical protein [Planctomycetota bacterium]
MKRQFLISLPLATCLVLLAGAASPTLQDTQGDHAEDEDQSPLAQGMSRLNRSLRTLRKALRDESRKAESLEAIVDAQRGVSQAKTEVPPFTAAQPEDEREAFVLAYRLQMIQVERDLLDLEKALLSGDDQAAQKMLRTVKRREGPGHEKFTEEEE